MIASADIIGILVGQKHNSNDFISKEQAKKIVDYVNKRISVALVTHLKEAKEIVNLTKYIGNDIIQLHSDIEEQEVEKIKEELPAIKLIRLVQISKEGKVITDISKIKYVDYYLLDSFNLKTNQIGGTGIIHDWSKSKELVEKLKYPVFLAGGLNPSNVKTAIAIVNPYGVDVNSGCKTNDKKDRNKVIEFVKKANDK